MKDSASVKAFKAVNSTTVIKQFLNEPVFPEGWYKSVYEALDAFNSDNPEVKEPVRKAGRPRKAE